MTESVKIGLDRYNDLLRSKSKLDAICKLCAQNMVSNHKMIDRAVENGESYLVGETYVSLEDICEITNWSLADSDKLHVKIAKEKIKEMKENKG